MVTIEQLEAFFDHGWNGHDVDVLMTFMSDDCVFEAAAGRDACGMRHAGRARVREAFARVFASFPDVRFDDARQGMTCEVAEAGNLPGVRVHSLLSRPESGCTAGPTLTGRRGRCQPGGVWPTTFDGTPGRVSRRGSAERPVGLRAALPAAVRRRFDPDQH